MRDKGIENELYSSDKGTLQSILEQLAEKEEKGNGASKIEDIILESTADFMVAILYDARSNDEWTLFKTGLEDEKIEEIRKMMLAMLRSKAQNDNTITISAHNSGSEFIDEVLKNAQVYVGNKANRHMLCSRLIYPKDFICKIHKHYATYACDDEERAVSEAIIALDYEGAKEILLRVDEKLENLPRVVDERTNEENIQSIYLQKAKVKNFLNRNNIGYGGEPLDMRIEKLKGFRPQYKSWGFLNEEHIERG